MTRIDVAVLALIAAVALALGVASTAHASTGTHYFGMSGVAGTHYFG